MSLVVMAEWIAAASIGGTMEDAARLLTPSPKEAALSAGGARTIDIDLGQAIPVDMITLAHTNAPDGFAFSVSYGVGGYSEHALGNLVAAPARKVVLPRHMLMVVDEPVTARFIRLSSAAVPAGFYAGILSVSQAMRTQYGHEWGSGRFVVDTGSAARLMSGGFGINRGARFGGWQWTFGDLDDAETDALYAMQLRAGMTSPIIVVEDPDITAGLNERIHYGLLTRLEAFERQDTTKTRWLMRVEDWQ